MIILNKLIITVIVIFLSSCAYAKPRIVVSTTPIASIVAMLTGNSAEILTVNTSSGCPHHYHARPSDRLKFQDATMVVYIDDNFDSYMSKMLDNFSGIKVKVSDISEITMKNLDGRTNWHFWLDLNNVLVLQTVLAKRIKDACPELDDIVSNNFANSREKLFELTLLKKNGLQNLSDIILLSDSLEYFFNNTKAKVTRLYQPQNSSLKYLNDLEKNIKEGSEQCLVIDESQDPNSFKRFNKKIIQLNGENWESNSDNSNLFFIRYLDMLNKLKECQL